MLVESGREDQGRHVVGGDGLHHTKAIQAGQLQIQHEQIGAQRADGVDRFQAVRTLRHQHEIGVPLDSAPEAEARERLVVDRHDADRALFHASPRGAAAPSAVAEPTRKGRVRTTHRPLGFACSSSNRCRAP
jgi:hypothetical protein